MVKAYDNSVKVSDNIFHNAKEAFRNGDISLAHSLFLEAETCGLNEILRLIYIEWINYILCDGDSENELDACLSPIKQACGELSCINTILSMIEEEFGLYLDVASEVYAMNYAFGDIEDIISPRGISIVKLFRFAGILVEELSLQYCGVFLVSIKKWINSLTMRLFRQAEFSGIRLKLPVEFLTRRDIENADVIFKWLDSVYDAVLNINPDIGARFFELQIAFRLDLVGKCLPRLIEVCRAYMFYFPSQLYEADMEIDRAKLYAFMILTMCYSLSSYDVTLKKKFVEAVPLLRNLRIVHAKNYGAEDYPDPEDLQARDIHYEMPEEEWRDFLDKAGELIKKIWQEDKYYVPPPAYNGLITARPADRE